MAGPPASALLVTGLARPLQNQASETYRNEVSSNADHQQRTFRSHPSRQVGPTLPAWGRSIGLEDGSKQEPSPGQSGRGLLVVRAPCRSAPIGSRVPRASSPRASANRTLVASPSAPGSRMRPAHGFDPERIERSRRPDTLVITIAVRFARTRAVGGGRR